MLDTHTKAIQMIAVLITQFFNISVFILKIILLFPKLYSLKLPIGNNFLFLIQTDPNKLIIITIKIDTMIRIQIKYLIILIKFICKNLLPINIYILIIF
jgi:hypothetical protein